MPHKHSRLIPLLTFSFFLGLGTVSGQTDKPPATSKRPEASIPTCDSSLRIPVPGESLADAARRMRAWKDCAEKIDIAGNRLGEQLVKRVEVESGHLTVATLPPGFATSNSLLVSRLDIYLYNRSPIKHGYTLMVRCGKWSKTVTDSVAPSEAAQPGQGLGKPSFSFDVSPTCNLNDVALDLSSPEAIKGIPEQTSTSVVPGVSDEEMAQRLRSLQGSTTTTAPGAVGNSISDLQRRVDEACKGQSVGELANAPTSRIGENMTACAKAYDDLTAALKVQGEAQNKARTEALNHPVPSGVLVVRLTGTEGLPFSGTCYYSNRAGTTSKTYDEVLPFQATIENVDSVNCSFISKSDFHHDLKLEIVKDGKVIGESDTDAPYGLVGVTRDVN